METDDLRLDGAGSVIRDYRIKAGLTLRQCAKELGWDPGRLSKYETGALAVSASVIEAVAPKLRQRPEVLLLECVRRRYPEFNKSKSGKMIENLIENIRMDE